MRRKEKFDFAVSTGMEGGKKHEREKIHSMHEGSRPRQGLSTVDKRSEAVFLA